MLEELETMELLSKLKLVCELGNMVILDEKGYQKLYFECGTAFLKEIFGDYRFTFPENSVELEDLFTRVFTMYTRLTERSGIFDKYITDTKVLEQYHKFEDLVIRYNKATTREEQQNVVKESLALIREIYPITTSERTNSTSPRNLSPEMIYFRPIVQFLTTTQYANNFGLTKEEKELIWKKSTLKTNHSIMMKLVKI